MGRSSSFCNILHASGQKSKRDIRAPNCYGIRSGDLSPNGSLVVDQVAIRVVLDDIAGRVEPICF